MRVNGGGGTKLVLVTLARGRCENRQFLRLVPATWSHLSSDLLAHSCRARRELSVGVQHVGLRVPGSPRDKVESPLSDLKKCSKTLACRQDVWRFWNAGADKGQIGADGLPVGPRFSTPKGIL